MEYQKVEVITTNDGSSSLFLESINETYHSKHGAKTESVYVYITQGVEHFLLKRPDAKSLNIFEMGFGTGLNTMLAFEFATENKLLIRFTTIEPYPIAPEIAATLNYGNAEALRLLHAAEWEREVTLNEFFSLTKRNVTLEDFEPQPDTFDLIFFDAFGMNKHSSIWSEANLLKCRQMLKPGGVWVTYAATGYLTRTLKSIQMEVKKLPGAPGKREMTRAIKPEKIDI